jgi:NAD(P)-dependent dehydrogenase (short-subunit alcohol dehydrogenase family)
MRLANKNALITGALGDIGFATAEAFIAQGARVTLVDLDQKKLDEAVASFAPGACIGVAADVTSAAQTQDYVAKAVEAFGPIDIFFDNAGIEGAVDSLENYSDDSFDAVMAVNVKGVFLGLKHVSPQMRAGGSIIITSSIMGLAASNKTIGYTASKHAVVGLMRTAAKALATRRIRVNTIHPGYVESRMMKRLEQTYQGPAPEAVRAAREAEIPMGRYVTPQEIAKSVVFLGSDDSSMVTGQTLAIDGGWML